MKNIFLVGFVALLLLVFGCTSGTQSVQNPPTKNPEPTPTPANPNPQPSGQPSPTPQPTPEPTPQPSPTPAPKEVTIKITAKQFSFDPGTITLKKGDTVHIIITSVDVTHGFSIPAYDINKQIVPGSETKIDFVADKSGTFDFRCSVMCGAGHSEMVGKLIVQE
ncbi:cupredoxin domain-containing protein [Candidatus Micrarchaeota archaeon]|nr:cupredoxin domain-containing protein [Candidatus Micrarchaeota archaeon]